MKKYRSIYYVTYNLVVTLGTTMFKAKKFYTSYAYFLMDLRTTGDYSQYSINWLVFIAEKECLLRGTNLVFKSNSVQF